MKFKPGDRVQPNQVLNSYHNLCGTVKKYVTTDYGVIYVRIKWDRLDGLYDWYEQNLELTSELAEQKASAEYYEAITQ